MRTSFESLTKLYINEIARPHGVLKAIVLDRDLRFTYMFWRAFQKALESRIKMGFAFHP